jgi:hypothetical protein
VNRFGYWRDRLCVAACAAYALNRWALKPRVHWSFLHDHFNDVLLIPAALPLVLWVQRRRGLRTHDQPPTWAEVALHWAVWSAVCEFFGPRFLHKGTADPWDVACYGLGGIAACLWWRKGPVQTPR